ncbi:hypothetical protein BH23BAC1_BH23BAC1_06160 [soil metagenome]
MKNSNLFNNRIYCCTYVKWNLINSIKLFSFLYLSFLILCVQNSYCQTSINGYIKDGQGHPLAFANVLLLQQTDSSLVKGVISDEKGRYFISEVKAGSYLVSSSMIGFRTMYSLPLSIIDEANSMVDFTLPEAISELSEVVIKASKPLFEQQMDELVVNVKSSIISSGSTVLGVLARTPGVSVNQQNNTITMNGKEGVMIMLNGKLVRLPLSTVVQMLSGMNADQVEKIEIITSPSARYDAEGNAGLINIVNSKVQDIGTNGSFSGNLGYGYFREGYERYGGSLNLNYRTERVSFYLDYSGMMDHFIMLSTNERKIRLPGQETQSSFQGKRDFKNWTQNFRSGIELALNPKTTIGSQFTAFSIKNDQLAFNKTIISEAGIIDTRINVRDRERNHWWNYAVNLNLTHNFTPDQSISADADYLYYFHNNPHNYLFNYHFLQGNQQEEEQLVNSKHTPIHMWVGKIDYKHRINDRFSMEAGIKGFLSDVDNEIIANRSREGSWFRDTLMSQHVMMEENIGAAYLSLNTTLNAKTKLQTGLR